MIVVIDIRGDLRRRAQALVPDRYETLDELLNAALENQLVLEERSEHGSRSQQSDPSERTSQSIPRSLTSSDKFWQQLRRLDGAQIVVDELKRPPGQDFPLLWGQVNRLLPVAAGLRVLGNIQRRDGVERVALDRWYEEASRIAVALREAVAQRDSEAARPRGELWVTGLPKADSGSLRRFTNQFLARRSASNPGAAEALGLVVVERGLGGPEVAVSGAGIRWASFENPIFDGSTPSMTFSEDEAKAYLALLEENLPKERRFMATVAQLIERSGSRTALEKALIEAYPQWRKIVPTLRAGAIGRMHDLGLLERTRHGTAVEYELSARAKRLGLEEN